MRKFTAIIAALALLGTTSLTPIAAAPSGDLAVKNDDFSAAKRSKKAKKKKAEVTVTDELSAAKRKKKAKKKKAEILYSIAA